MRKTILTMLTALLFASGAWATSGDVLLNQTFNTADGAGSLAYTANTARAYTTADGKGLTGVVGSGANLFSSITCGAGSDFGIGINHATGGNSKDWTGKFGVYGNSNGGSRYWSIVKKNIATTAPNAIKISFKASYSPNGSTGSNPGVQFAVGTVSDGITTTPPALTNLVAGFSIPQQTSAKIAKYVAGTSGNTAINSSGTAVSFGTETTYTWIINNTNDDLEYTNPNSSKTTVNAGCWDLWVGTTLNLHNISKSTTGMSGTSLNGFYIGNATTKKHTFTLDDFTITDLTPASGKTATTTTIIAASKSALNSDIKNGTSAGTLEATVTGGPGGETITWSSTDGSVATINSSGAVTLVAPGTTTISASYAGNASYDESSDSFELTVTDSRTALSATWSPTSLDCEVGSSPASPIFSVTGGEAELGTDYTVAYEKVSGDNLATIESTGITDIATGTPGTETVKATVTITNNSDYRISETEYLLVITVQYSYAISYNANGGSGSMANTIGNGSVTLSANTYAKTGYTFIGWATSQANANSGTVAYADGAEYTLSADATLYAVWGESYCYLVPATSGDAPTVKNQVINVQSGSFGGAIYTAGAKDNNYSEAFAYTSSGLALQKGGADSIRVELNDYLKEGSIIVVKLVAGNSGARGLKLKKAGQGDVASLGWSNATNGAELSFKYTVTSSDGLKNTKKFWLQRNNTVYLKSVSVVNAQPGATVSSTGWATYSSNKALDLSTISNGEAFVATSTSGNDVVLSPCTGIVAAGTGLMIKGESGAKFTIDASSSTPNFSGINYLVGCPAATVLSTNANHYVMVSNGGVAEFQSLTEHGATIPAGKAYLDLTSLGGAPDRMRIVEAENGATDVNNIEANEKAVKFMENGQIYILRDGVVYDAVGRVIRK